MTTIKEILREKYWILVLVAALGYFVDIYDLLLFSIVRVSSLKDLGIQGDEILNKGIFLINCQMSGLLVGGILWGILGDRKGRLSVLFGSILLYSIANLGNAFVHNIELYALLRFIAGVGLAGELGAGITLAVEVMPQHLRGYGTAIIASIGICGAVAGGLIGDAFHWRTAYIIGGLFGLLLLALRLGVTESNLFLKAKSQSEVSRGNFLSLFTDRKRFTKYLCVILIGMPLWFVVGILVTFAPEFSGELHLTDVPKAGLAVMFCYAGLAIGDLASGIISQKFKSRKKVIFAYVFVLGLTIVTHLYFPLKNSTGFYTSCFIMGLFAGYWALFVTVAAEQFGTNLRSTVATTVPNFVRGSVIPLTLLFRSLGISVGLRESALIVGVITVVIGLTALRGLEETYHKDLNYLEPT